MRLDVGERVNALVYPDRQAAARQRLEAFEIVGRPRLLEKEKLGLARALHIATGIAYREPAIGVGAKRHLGAQRLPDRERGRDLLLDRLHADLELEQMEAFGLPGARFLDVLIGRRIAKEPHRPHSAAPLAADQI